MTRFQDRVALLGAEVEMMQGFQKEGGAAFPIDTANVTFYGMSMRDYFAARSLAGLCANPGGPFQANGMCGWSIVNCTTDQVAQECYRLAESSPKQSPRNSWPKRPAGRKDLCGKRPARSMRALAGAGGCGLLRRMFQDHGGEAMPLKVFRSAAASSYSYSGTVAGRRLRGSTGTTDKARAERIAAERESAEWKRHLDGPRRVLTFAKARCSTGAGKQTKLPAEDRGLLERHAGKGHDRRSDPTERDRHLPEGRRRHAQPPGHHADAGDHQPLRRNGVVPADPGKAVHVRQEDQDPDHPRLAGRFCAHAEPAHRRARRLHVRDGLPDLRGPPAAMGRHRLSRSHPDHPDQDKKERLPHMPQRLLVALANLPRDKRPLASLRARYGGPGTLTQIHHVQTWSNLHEQKSNLRRL
jgi:hypothetical protein